MNTKYIIYIEYKPKKKYIKGNISSNFLKEMTALCARFVNHIKITKKKIQVKTNIIFIFTKVNLTRLCTKCYKT